MKIVFNNEYGGYGYEVADEFKDFVNKFSTDRTNEELVKFVEENPDKCGDLDIVEIPDNATDYELLENDGLEEVIYVLDGKIYYAE